MTTFTIEGAAVHDIASLYNELDRVFMADEDWQLGPSLDALNDLLHGGFGALHGHDAVRIVWRDHAASRRALGRETTAEYYREKLRHPETFSAERFEPLLDAVEAGTGSTYFDIVLEVFADHPEIELVLA
ncbi:barstar family protein [Microbacterium invictum]|uniref:RNAse (Barnase) inhibitor barstar n=1 Tax=Microbacterium invictum TaxID=515415 RepID=A0AA40SLQ4_9MICO|nr:MULTISPECIES: barstar family protein [Microbacterium]MBB4138533.1 RNAse (barnase) inhibitor barstar [Microbacterium invictum]